MATQNNSLHYSEQRKRAQAACLALGKTESYLSGLLANPESLTALQIAEGNAFTLLSILKEAREIEELKRAADVREAFDSKTLFSGVAA
jgi:hypothetical protein